MRKMLSRYSRRKAFGICYGYVHQHKHLLWLRLSSVFRVWPLLYIHSYTAYFVVSLSLLLFTIRQFSIIVFKRTFCVSTQNKYSSSFPGLLGLEWESVALLLFPIVLFPIAFRVVISKCSLRSLILYLATIWQNLACCTGVRSFSKAGNPWGSVAVLFVINLFLPGTLLLF